MVSRFTSVTSVPGCSVRKKPAGTVELGSAEIELLDVPRGRAEDEDEPSPDTSNAKTELAFAKAGASLAPLRTSSRSETRGKEPGATKA